MVIIHNIIANHRRRVRINAHAINVKFGLIKEIIMGRDVITTTRLKGQI